MRDQEKQALEQYEFHRRERDRLRKVMADARSAANAHDQIMDGLVRLYPSVRAERNRILHDRNALNLVLIQQSKTRAENEPALPIEAPEVESAIPDLPEPRLTGISAVREILEVREGAFLSASAIHKLLLEAGLIKEGPNSLRVVRNTLNRAVRSDLVVRRTIDDRVVYAWKPQVDGKVGVTR
jgi:hypothetical protein